MRDLSTGHGLQFEGDTLRRAFDAKDRIGTDVTVWHLSEIATLVTPDTIQDAERRAREAQAARSRNVLLGGVAGGLLDAASGDDGILDGVLVGATFGYLTSNRPGPVTAQVGIVFRDGTSLCVEVDRDEYTRLQTAAAQALRAADPDAAARPAVEHRAMTRAEGREIIALHKRRASSENYLAGVVCFVGVASAPYVFSIVFESWTAPDWHPFVAIVALVVIALGTIFSNPRGKPLGLSEKRFLDSEQ